MSGIAVIFGRDERPVEPGLMDTLLSAIAHRGPDGSNSWSSGPVALGHAMLHTTPESILEIQPFKDEAANLCLVLDGRIDNRAELAAALRGNGVELRSDTDSELLLRAYQCWG